MEKREAIYGVVNDMKDDIIQNIIWNAGGEENLVTLKQDDESLKEYRERLFQEAHELFMGSVEELGLDTLNDEDEAPYDNIRDEVIQEIVDMPSGKK
jgi:hypothetical protein